MALAIDKENFERGRSHRSSRSSSTSGPNGAVPAARWRPLWTNWPPNTKARVLIGKCDVGGERRHHDEVRRAQHPDDRLPQGRRAGRQAGRRTPEGRTRRRRSRNCSEDAPSVRLARDAGRGVLQGRLHGPADSGDGREPRAAGQYAAGRGDSAHAGGPARSRRSKGRPHVFGLPILFPPNRIADGRYTLRAAATYQLSRSPSPKEHNYHHGILKSQPFAVSKAWRDRPRRCWSSAATIRMPETTPIFRDFPHEFKCKITYRLTAEGLEQEVMFANRSARFACPWAWDFTRRCTIPFAGGDAADYVMRVAVGEQVETERAQSPDGTQAAAVGTVRQMLREGGLRVTDCEPIEAGFTLREIEVDGKPFRGCAGRESAARACGLSTRSTPQTTYWTIWNNGGPGALLLSRTAVVDHERPERRGPCGRRFSGHRPGRKLAHEVPARMPSDLPDDLRNGESVRILQRRQRAEFRPAVFLRYR